MPGLGSFNPFPLRLGGGRSSKREELEALLESFRAAWDDGDDTANWAEAGMMAVAMSIVWACNRRLANQAIPSRMLEQLPVWEDVLGLKPAATDTDVQRRAAVAAHLRGAGDNTIGGLSEALSLVLGANFEEIIHVLTADEITYWPGVNPGPPGFEWASNRAHVGVKTNKSTLSEEDFISKRASAVRLLDNLLPSYVRFTVGVGDGFVLNQGLLGQTLL